MTITITITAKDGKDLGKDLEKQLLKAWINQVKWNIKEPYIMAKKK